MTRAPFTELDRVLREQGRTGNWLAAQVGVAPETITRWRRAQTHASQESMERVALALGRKATDGPALFLRLERTPMRQRETA